MKRWWGKRKTNEPDCGIEADDEPIEFETEDLDNPPPKHETGVWYDPNADYLHRWRAACRCGWTDSHSGESTIDYLCREHIRSIQFCTGKPEWAR